MEFSTTIYRVQNFHTYWLIFLVLDIFQRFIYPCFYIKIFTWESWDILKKKGKCNSRTVLSSLAGVLTEKWCESYSSVKKKMSLVKINMDPNYKCICRYLKWFSINSKHFTYSSLDSSRFLALFLKKKIFFFLFSSHF